jgi:transcription antitermination factor NusG
MALSADQNPTQLFPPTVLEEPPPGGAWWVAHTKSRREKVLADFLGHRKIGYYLPLIKKRQPAAGRQRYSFVPLFSGYVFFNGGRDERSWAYASNQIARVLEVKDQEKLCRELRAIRQVIEANAMLSPCDFYNEGQRVRVSAGPLKGIEGVVDRKNGAYRLVLSVTSVAQSFAVNVDAGLVETV